MKQLRVKLHHWPWQACVQAHRMLLALDWIGVGWTISFVLKPMRSSLAKVYHQCTDVSRERINNLCLNLKAFQVKSNLQKNSTEFLKFCRFLPIERSIAKAPSHWTPARWSNLPNNEICIDFYFLWSDNQFSIMANVGKWNTSFVCSYIHTYPHSYL